MTARTAPSLPPLSRVLETPAAPPEQARQHFLARLSVETDPSDVRHDLEQGVPGFVVLDARAPEAFARRHIPGARSLPYRTISPETTAGLSKDDLLVVYCWSPACNAAHKAAVRLSALGFRVKEMLGGLEYWVKEGFPTEGSLPAGTPVYGTAGEQ
jgi:rhodanese-related sulfurtransferase